ncbi:MAG: type I DNA topoisomerase [Paludibacteraceae bacterium]|nr:type I DNA topoisomerase [Paludibacteraceae bacterium]
MKKNLVIVESPAKAKTIEKFLGKEFSVMSSFGHIRDLKEKEFSVDIEHNFQPIYVVPSDKKKLVGELKKAAAEAEIVWLASDEDREGEAIAWHLLEALSIPEDKTKRIVFHEITQSAILHAIEHPRTIDRNLVDAQQARRVLDRVVGFKLSPILWKKIKPSLSAGRVQSVAVRLIVEREREIQRFVAESSYKVTALFLTKNSNGEDVEIKAELQNRFSTKQEAEVFLQKCVGAEFSVEDISTKPGKKSPAPPFTTSTLQQEAARKLGFSVAQTMRVAQKLYEEGKITYMRTDSVNLSSLALNTAKEEILSLAGEKYWHLRKFQTKTKGAQEAHEAIRPTYMSRHEVEGTSQEKRLYDLIWKRTLASQMSDAEIERTNITIGSPSVSEKFVATGEVITFDGFLRIYTESVDEESAERNETTLLPKVKLHEQLELKKSIAQQRFTQKPARYTEASLVKKLEELGIGRPSTYAPTISTIQNRAYVEKKEIENQPREYTLLTLEKGKIKETTKTDKASVEKGKLSPTDIGMVVNDYLIDNFPNIMNFNFTADVEKQFDEIAEGQSVWTSVIDKFYQKFNVNIEKALKTTGKKVGEREVGIDPKSGKPVFVKIGRYGAVAQIGSATDEEKPLFASLQKGQSIETITLEEVLNLFKLPMDVGEFEGEMLTVAVGRFGPYVKHGKTFVAIPKGEEPLNVTYDRAVELVVAKREADKNKEIKKFEKENIFVLNGRFGPYISYNKKNFKIPKNLLPEELTLEDCQKIINGEPKTKKTRKTSKK